jgi:hypothetical protein
VDSGCPNSDNQKLRSDNDGYRRRQEKEKENRNTGIERRNDMVIMEDRLARLSSIA